MDRILGYGLTLTIGIGATTIAAAVVGNPIPVVIPAGVAGGAVGVHHKRHSDDGPASDDDDVESAIQAVEADGGREQ